MPRDKMVGRNGNYKVKENTDQRHRSNHVRKDIDTMNKITHGQNAPNYATKLGGWWCFDTGSNTHIVGDKDYFVSLKEAHEEIYGVSKELATKFKELVQLP